MVRNSFFIILLLLFSIAGLAQRAVPFKANNGNDIYGNVEKTQIEYLYEIYSLKIKASQELINGREFFPYYYRSNLKPLLFLNKKYSSSITVKGREYNGIMLHYDTFSDQVIYVDSTKLFNFRPIEVALNKDNIDFFTLNFTSDTMLFRYLSKKVDPDFDLQDGFYEVAYDKESKYIIRHRSVIHEKNGIDEYYYSTISYVNVGNGFFKIRSTGQFVKLFGDKSDDVRKFINRSGIHIRKAGKTNIISVLKYYDSLGNLTK
jgi:hypothetical protein